MQFDVTTSHFTLQSSCATVKLLISSLEVLTTKSTTMRPIPLYTALYRWVFFVTAFHNHLEPRFPRVPAFSTPVISCRIFHSRIFIVPVPCKDHTTWTPSLILTPTLSRYFPVTSRGWRFSHSVVTWIFSVALEQRGQRILGSNCGSSSKVSFT